MVLGTHSDFIAENFVSPTAGQITNRYGLNIAFDNTNVTNAFGVYQSSNTLKNYFAGNVGIGTSTPVQKLTVVGSIGQFVDNSTNYSIIQRNASIFGFMGNTGNYFLIMIQRMLALRSEGEQEMRGRTPLVLLEMQLLELATQAQ